MTAWCSTASSTASWRRPAIPPAPARGGSGQKLRAEFNEGAAYARRRVDGARADRRIPPTASSSSASTTRRFLDGQYTVWGRVSEGMENVDKITRGEPPRKPDKIVTMRVAADAG